MEHRTGSLAARGFQAFGTARSLVAILKDPDDTKEVFRLLSSFGGPTAGFRRSFEDSRAGARLLAERPQILRALRDRDALTKLPEGSLGRAYLAFMQRDGLDPEWLVEASQVEERAANDDVEAYVGDRMRDTHDLWHVLTGYGGDLLGEAALIAFTYAQTWSPGLGLLVVAALAKADEPDARRLVVDGFVRGLRAAWLPAAAWEELLAAPLEDVRARLRVGPPPTYEPFYAKDLPAGGLLARAA